MSIPGPSRLQSMQDELSGATEPLSDQAANNTTSTAPELDLDHVFDVLANRRRRRVLRYLSTTDGQATIGELADHVAALEHETPPLTSTERKRVYVGLYQNHLPKMDEIDVIEYNKPRGTITRGPTAEQVELYLTHPSHAETLWPQYYLAIAGISGMAEVGHLVFGGGDEGFLPVIFAGMLASYVVLALWQLWTV